MEEKNNDQKILMPADRLKAMTDAFYPFAMTLLVLTIDVPKIENINSIGDFNQAIWTLLPNIFNFALSFLLLAIFWLINHREFQNIKRVDASFLWLNFLSLILVVFIPFTTELMGDFGKYQMANIIFAINLMLIGVVNYFIWEYAYFHNLTDIKENTKAIKKRRYKSLATPIVSLLVIIISFFSSDYCTLGYLFIPVFLRIYQ